MTNFRDGLSTHPPPKSPARGRGANRSHPANGSIKDKHPRIIVAFPDAEFSRLAADAFARKLPLSAYIRALVLYALAMKGPSS